MRKVILSLGMSLDGYIADEKGGYDWIVGDGNSNLNTENKFDFMAFVETTDTIILGKKAYEDCDMSMFSQKLVVFTHSPGHDENVEYRQGDIVEYLNEERKKDGKDIYVFGGAVLIQPLLKTNLIDEYIIGIIPTILGKGRKLFLEEHDPILLTTQEVMVEEGQVIIHYKRR